VKPIRTETLLLTSILALVIALAAILAGFTAYVTHRSRELEQQAERALLQSLRQELGSAYASLDDLMQTRRESLRQAHRMALDYVRREGLDAPLAPLREQVAQTMAQPVEIAIIDGRQVPLRSTVDPSLNADDSRSRLTDMPSDAGTIVGPRLERASERFQLATYSSLANGLTLKMTFQAPLLTQFFDSAQQRLSTRVAYDAELFFLMPDGRLLSLRDTATATPKHSRDLPWFRQAAARNQIVQPEAPGNNAVYYVPLVNVAPADAAPIQVAARVRMQLGLGEPIRQTLFSAVGVASVLMLAVLLLVYLLLRRGLVRPLRAASTAIERWQPILLPRAGRTVAELQLLASRYNTMLDDAQTRIQGLDKLASTDALTGLANRARLETEIEIELRTARRYDQPCALILIDIDHFKRINDRHGHLAGDEVLRNLAAILREGVRESDTVARWGGEEFLVLCRRTRLDAAVFLARTLNQLVAAHTFGDVTHCTASFGVTASHPDDSLETLFGRADAALYQAKATGRNRVVAGDAAADTRPAS
jgi:diguanylate cyclase (GGDEF)-like protein